MSFDRSGGRAQGRRRTPGALEAALETRASMQEQFYRVDQAQSDIGGTVTGYAAVLPDRARASGVVPAWSELDSQAHALIVSYLELLDRFDPLEELSAAELHQAQQAFVVITPQLGRLAEEMDRFLERFGPELRRVGEAREQVRRRVGAATARVEEAETAWRRMQAEGYRFDRADQAIARARVAGRRLADLAAQLTPAQVEEPATVVEKLAGEALALATELPRRAATLTQRITSLATRIDALETRAQSVPEAMRALRREFSVGNWKDLADREHDVARLLEGARSRVREMRRLHAAGDHEAALGQLDRLDQELKHTGEMVDGPRSRLARLRELKADPRPLLERVRFTIRDARYLIMKGRNEAPQPWGARLDAAARELIGLEEMLKGTHPDYWRLQQRVDALQRRVRELIDEVRAAG